MLRAARSRPGCETGAMRHSVRDCRVVVGGLDHVEGVAFGPDRRLYAGGEAGQIYRVGADGSGLEEYANVGGMVGGVCLDADGTLYECNYGTLRVNRVRPDG